MDGVGVEVPRAGAGQARTRRARAAVLAAARERLVADGYVATTVAGISDAAGVPATTVYRLFSSKVEILKAVLDLAIAGDADEVPVAARSAVRDALDDPDPRARIARFVDVTATINQRVAALYRVLLTAADADPEAAGYLGELTAQRQQGQGVLVRSLAASGALTSGLDEREAADVVHALMSPEVYRMLVLDRGWSPERYSGWLAETLSGQLLPSSAEPDRAQVPR